MLIRRGLNFNLWIIYTYIAHRCRYWFLCRGALKHSKYSITHWMRSVICEEINLKKNNSNGSEKNKIYMYWCHWSYQIIHISSSIFLFIRLKHVRSYSCPTAFWLSWLVTYFFSQFESGILFFKLFIILILISFPKKY